MQIQDQPGREFGRYLAVRNSDSAQALSSLTRGREYEGLTPSMAGTG